MRIFIILTSDEETWLINMLIEPLVSLMKDEFVQEQLGEVARLFYSNDSVTINLYAAAAAAVLFTLCKLKNS